MLAAFLLHSLLLDKHGEYSSSITSHELKAVTIYSHMRLRNRCMRLHCVINLRLLLLNVHHYYIMLIIYCTQTYVCSGDSWKLLNDAHVYAVCVASLLSTFFLLFVFECMLRIKFAYIIHVNIEDSQRETHLRKTETNFILFKYSVNCVRGRGAALSLSYRIVEAQ